MKDTILFIGAYKSIDYKPENFLLKKFNYIFPIEKKEDIKSLLEKYHLSYMATDDVIAFIDSNMRIDTQYDYVHQKTALTFKQYNSSNKDIDYVSRIKDTGFYVNLRHAQSFLFDDQYFKINLTFWFNPFLVWINDHIYQVDAGAFIMNSVIFTVFELIDFETKKTITKEEVYGKKGNYNLLSVNKIQFFDEEEPKLSKIKIPDYIHDTICSFLNELTKGRLNCNECSFIYDTAVFSNNIVNISDYICKFVGVKKNTLRIRDISTVDTYEYYPQDGCAVITNFENENTDMVLYPVIILEAIKLYIYLFQISTLKSVMDIHQVITDNIYLQNLFCSPKLPIEAHNLLDYIKESETYKKHSEAVSLKISYLTLQNDLKKNRNATILNILLYIISLIGSISTLEVIEKYFDIPFKFSFIIVIVLFVVGLIWWIKEFLNNKSI